MGFYEEISSNKTKSVLLTFFFFLFLVLVVWIFATILNWGFFGVVFAFALAVLMSVGSYYYSDSLVLKISGARPATRQEFVLLNNLTEGLCIAAGIPRPKLFVIEDTAPNAFATGRDPVHSVVCVTTG